MDGSFWAEILILTIFCDRLWLTFIIQNTGKNLFWVVTSLQFFLGSGVTSANTSRSEASLLCNRLFVALMNWYNISYIHTHITPTKINKDTKHDGFFSPCISGFTICLCWVSNRASMIEDPNSLQISIRFSSWDSLQAGHQPGNVTQFFLKDTTQRI